MPLATRGATRAIIQAAEEICGQLARTPIRIAEADDTKTLRDFAEIPQETTLSLTA